MSIAVLYLALILSLPFLPEETPAAALFALWLGGSLVAGTLLRQRWMYLLPLTAFLVLATGGLVLGAFDHEFFIDPLTGMALIVLLGGEAAGLAVGAAVRTWWLARGVALPR